MGADATTCDPAGGGGGSGPWTECLGLVSTCSSIIRICCIQPWSQAGGASSGRPLGAALAEGSAEGAEEDA